MARVVAAEPRLATQISPRGITPLWWLPDDEAAAAEIVDLFLSNGADPSVKARDGSTAADYARNWNLGDEANPCDLKRSIDPSGKVRSGYVPPPVLIA